MHATGRALVGLVLPVLVLATFVVPVRAEFRAGAAIVDITPQKLPVLVNGGMTSRSIDKIKAPIHARALALSDGKTQLAMVVVDSCMMGRELLDEVKARAAKRTGIPADRMAISATHAHSVPSSTGCLGTDPDPNYVPFLRDRLVEVIAAAQAVREPARAGFAKIAAPDYTALRQWIRRPDRVVEDPFGNLTVRANMHAGANWDHVTGEAGPKDPDLTLISVQARDGRPLAVLANFSMHYFSDRDISPDYYGLFCDGLRRRIAPNTPAGKPAFVGIICHGCSGDIWRRDYTRPQSWNPKLTIEQYADGLLDLAMKAYAGIRYRDDVDLSMAERRMTLHYRVPDKQRLEWAERIVAGMGGRPPKTLSEVYAREQILLHQRQQAEVVVQAVRLGDIGIATTSCETYAITGLKIKAASPLPNTMIVELANGADGYIPPPEQHLFGGYNTWPARSAGLEVTAEPKIAEAAIELLEKTSGRPRREWKLGAGPATEALLAAKPIAYWRLNEFAGPQAADATGLGHDAVYEPEITYYLEGPRSARFCPPGEVNRAPHFVGGRLRARLAGLGDRYSVSLWLWNGMPNDGRDTSGWLFSRGPDQGLSAQGEHLGVGGKAGHPGCLVFFHGDNPATALAGRTLIPRWEWQHVVLVRDGQSVRVYLNGRPEIDAQAPGCPAWLEQCFFGGRSDNDSNWEGRLDEVAVFNRPLSPAEVARLAAD